MNWTPGPLAGAHHQACDAFEGPAPVAVARRLRASVRLPRGLRARFAGALLAASSLAAPSGPASAQGFGSPAVPNVGPPGDALFPDIAALQDRLEKQGWIVRGQATFVLQGNTRFRSPYRGDGSLSPAPNARNTFSSDLVVGRRLWSGAEAVVDASVTRGFGLSNSTGVAAFPNNEAFRLGSTEPTFFVPRIFVRQTIGLSGDSVPPDGDALRFTEPLPRERLTITAGKFSVWDIFDDNRYAHDARTQFLNWAHVGAGGFDYAADARGWTYGVAAEWENGVWGVRAGAFQVARRVNGLFMDPAITRAWQVIGQVDRFYEFAAVRARAGDLRRVAHPAVPVDELFNNGFETFDRNPGGYRLKHNARSTSSRS
jgi:high affinity Mn2+ porin